MPSTTSVADLFGCVQKKREEELANSRIGDTLKSHFKKDMHMHYIPPKVV